VHIRSPITYPAGSPGESVVNYVLNRVGQLLNCLTDGYRELPSTFIACALPSYISQSSPDTTNCFGSLEEHNSFWNGTLIHLHLQVNIEYGFSDLEYFNSRVDFMEERLKALEEVCLKHESGQFLPSVGTTATAQDSVAIVE
jgi:hypothetical protein